MNSKNSERLIVAMTAISSTPPQTRFVYLHYIFFMSAFCMHLYRLFWVRSCFPFSKQFQDRNESENKNNFSIHQNVNSRWKLHLSQGQAKHRRWKDKFLCGFCSFYHPCHHQKKILCMQKTPSQTCLSSWLIQM